MVPRRRSENAEAHRSRRLVPRLASALAAVGIIAVVAAACSSSSSDQGAKADATAACQALARSHGDVSHPSLSLGYRLTGAANLGVAAAGEDPSTYGNLSKPMKQVQTDINLNSTKRTADDVKSALQACKADKLPS